MRKLVTLAVITACMVFLAVASPASAITVAAWASSPVTVGDKTFTLISTSWASNDNINIATFSGIYTCSVQPVSQLLTNTTKTLTYKVKIVDDPSTPQNEALLSHFSQISADGNRYIASGTFTTTGVFDDNSDFSSPLATFSNAGVPTGTIAIAGTVKELYVRLTITASGGSTILTSHTIAYSQASDPIATESETWGAIKSLYR